MFRKLHPQHLSSEDIMDALYGGEKILRYVLTSFLFILSILFFKVGWWLGVINLNPFAEDNVDPRDTLLFYTAVAVWFMLACMVQVIRWGLRLFIQYHEWLLLRAQQGEE